MIPIKVPPLGESIVEATVSRWLRKEGDAVAAGDALVELETDKITVEVPAPVAGVLTRRIASEGAVVKLDEIIAELSEGAPATGTATAPAAAMAAEAADQRAPSRHPDAPAAPSTPATPATPAAPAPRISPAAARLAAESGVDPATISGTGRSGVVSKPDVIEHIAAQAAPPPGAQPPAPASAPPPAPAPARTTQPTDVRETREKMSTRRKRIAEHLLESQHSTAQLTTFNEVDMTAIMQLRERTRDRVEKEHGVKLTFMPFFVKAACMALEQYPIINATVDGDTIVYRHYVNMGIAVASDQGLVVPNIRDVHQMGIIGITRTMNEVARRARDGKLTMDDLTGGTFTITNGGVFGSLVSTPIVNFPQSAILGLHKIQDRPVAVQGEVVVRPMMYLALSYDHRIIDGQQAVLFLVKVKELLEDPPSMLIS